MKFIYVAITLIFLTACAVGGKGGRDGGDANVSVGPIDGKIDACVGTTVECNKNKD